MPFGLRPSTHTSDIRGTLMPWPAQLWRAAGFSRRLSTGWLFTTLTESSVSAVARFHWLPASSTEALAPIGSRAGVASVSAAAGHSSSSTAGRQNQQSFACDVFIVSWSFKRVKLGVVEGGGHLSPRWDRHSLVSASPTLFISDRSRRRSCREAGFRRPTPTFRRSILAG